VNKEYTSVLLEQNFSKKQIAIVIKRQVRFNTNCVVIYSGKYDFDLAQRKNDKKPKRNDLTLEIKERIKEYLYQS
jgi:hypothetical protein